MCLLLGDIDPTVEVNMVFSLMKAMKRIHPLMTYRSEKNAVAL